MPKMREVGSIFGRPQIVCDGPRRCAQYLVDVQFFVWVSNTLVVVRGLPNIVMGIQNFVGAHNPSCAYMVAQDFVGAYGCSWSLVGMSGCQDLCGRVDNSWAVTITYTWSPRLCAWVPKIVGIHGCARVPILDEHFALCVGAQIVWAWTRKNGYAHIHASMPRAVGAPILTPPCPRNFSRASFASRTKFFKIFFT